MIQTSNNQPKVMLCLTKFQSNNFIVLDLQVFQVRLNDADLPRRNPIIQDYLCLFIEDWPHVLI